MDRVKKATWIGAMVALAIGGSLAQVNAEGIGDRSSSLHAWIEPDMPAYRTHNWYVGGGLGKGWNEEDGFGDTWNASVVAGYLWRSRRIGLGVEGDYTFRDVNDFDLEDGIWSLRFRGGVFLNNRTFLYGTIGTSQATDMAMHEDYDRGIVAGGGVEVDVASNMFLRLEGLHYTHTDEHLEWGDEGSTVVRGLVGFKF